MLKVLDISQDKAVITLYGEVGYEITAGALSEVLTQLPDATRRIEFLVHSPGGSVFEGYAFRNLLKAYDYEYTFVIQGIAASMMSYIVLAGRVEMYADAKLMIHAPSTGGYGDKNKLLKDIELLKKVEEDMSRAYAARLGISPEEVIEKYFDGQDHWFTAEEAVDLGLADGIREDHTAMAAFFRAYQQKKQSNMKLYEELKALCEPFGKVPKDETEAVQALRAGVAQLQTELATAKTELQQLKESLLAQKLEELKSEMQAKHLPAKTQEALLRIAKTDYEAAREAVQALGGADYVPFTNPKDRSDWSYEDWARKDPQGLLELAKNQPERFKELQTKRKK